MLVWCDPKSTLPVLLHWDDPCMLPVGNAAVREQYFGLEEDSHFLIGRKKRVAFLTAAVATASEAPT